MKIIISIGLIGVFLLFIVSLAYIAGEDDDE